MTDGKHPLIGKTSAEENSDDGFDKQLPNKPCSDGSIFLKLLTLERFVNTNLFLDAAVHTLGEGNGWS